MIAPDASIGKWNESRRMASHDCDRVTCDPHGFVNGIIMLPNSGQARAKPKCQTGDCCVRALSFFEAPVFQPPVPRRFEVDPSRSLTDFASQAAPIFSIGARAANAANLQVRGLSIFAYWIAASVAPRIAFGFSLVPLCTRPAASSSLPALTVCTRPLHELALPGQSPALTP